MPKPISNRISPALSARIVSCGFKDVTRLAEAMDVNPSSLQEFLKNKTNKSLLLSLKISKALNISVEDFARLLGMTA